MASLTKDRRLLFVAPDGKRRTIRLGKLPVKQHPIVQRHVERLLACQIDGSAPPRETTYWLGSLGDSLYSKLVLAELVEPKCESRIRTLRELVDTFKARPKWKSLKPNTRKNYARAFDALIEFFGADKVPAKITRADAADYYGHLMLDRKDGGRGLAASSANQLAASGYTLFDYAVDSDLMGKNPLRKVPRAPRKGNNVMVAESLSEEVLKAITDTQDKLVFGLSRWGGVRVPSEIVPLRWSDVDWENNRFQVHSPKTERHEGRDKRWVPMFPELVPLFDARFTEAAEGDEYVLPAYRRRTTTYGRNKLQVILKRAEIDPWPRLFHSMRSTRQTELVERFPVHVVCGWLGNTIDVASTYYLKVTEQHFIDAVKVAQKAAHHTSVKVRNSMEGDLADKH